MILKQLSLPSRTTTFQFLKYGLVGVSNTLLDFGTYLLLTRLTGFFGTYIFLAKALSFFIAASWSFFGNKHWTFSQSHKTTSKELWKFYTIATMSGVINVGIDYIVVRLFGLSDIIGIVFAAAATVIFGFILNKWWVFTHSNQHPE